MKKFALGLLGLVLLALSFYIVWVQFPKLNDPKLVQSTYQETGKRLEALLQGSGDPNQNGYLNPELLPFWGRPGIEFKDDSTPGETVSNWNAYCSTHQGDRVDHARFQKDQKYLRLRQEMDHLASEVKKAIEKPVFIPPNFELDYDSLTTNFISLRSGTQALSGLAEARAWQGDYRGASECLLTASNLGRRVESHGLLISTMIGLALQSIALDTSIGLFDINRNVSAKTWTNLSNGLLEAAPPENLLEHSIQGEMTAFHNTMELYRQGKYQDQELDQLRHFPGLLSREERIYLNTMTGLLHQLPAQNGLTIPPGARNPTAYDWISGKTGWLSQIMTPNFVRAGEQIELHRKSILAAATAYAIAAYRAQEGRLPTHLEDLKKAGIEIIDDPGFLSFVKYESDGQNGELRVKVLDSHSDLIIPSGQYWEHPWFEVDQEEVVYKFHPLSSDQSASEHHNQGRN